MDKWIASMRKPFVEWKKTNLWLAFTVGARLLHEESQPKLAEIFPKMAKCHPNLCNLSGKRLLCHPWSL